MSALLFLLKKAAAQNKQLVVLLFCGAGFPACHTPGRLESLPHKLHKPTNFVNAPVMFRRLFRVIAILPHAFLFVRVTMIG